MLAFPLLLFRSGWRRLDAARAHRPVVASFRTSTRLAQAPLLLEVPLFGTLLPEPREHSSTVVRILTLSRELAINLCCFLILCGPLSCNTVDFVENLDQRVLSIDAWTLS